MSPHASKIRRHALAVAAALALAGAAHAQLASSTIKGQITVGDGVAAQPGTVITAVNQATGNTWRTTTRADGSYVLTGLAPGSYVIRGRRPRRQCRPQVVTVQVGETASIDLALEPARRSRSPSSARCNART